MIRLCLFLIGCTASVVYSATDSASSADADKNSSSKDFQGQKLSWKDDDGLEVKIIRPIAQEKCALKSRPGDTVKQYYKLTDPEGKEIGSNFGEKPYSFTLGMHQVIEGMDRAMTGMCIGEKRRVTIPGKLGFGDGGRKRDGIKSDQVLHYIVQLVDLFRPTPGPRWREEDGLEIEVTHKIEESACRRSAPGDTIHQHYTLNLADGTFIDSSFSRSKDNGGLEVKIIRPIAQEKYALKSRPGDTVKQYYKLTDSDGKEIGSNFGEKSYSFMFGMHTVIERMDRVMTVMCFGEKLCVTIPGKFGDGGQKRDGIKSDQVLHYIVGLVYLFRPTPGPRWREKDGLEIEAVTHKIEEGACCRSALGDTIHQQYTLNLAEGGFIDSSFSRSKPFIFRLQHGQVIDGIDRVLTSGERRRVVIPAALGYGDQGRDIVPGGATLYFDIELHKLIKPRAD